VGTTQITIGDMPVRLRKCIKSPVFSGKTVLSFDTWDYVNLWLQRRKHQDALFYWKQSRYFYDATMSLEKTASPLTAYYCFLNATKALLLVKKEPFTEHHGVAGARKKKSSDKLGSDHVTFQTGGVLAALSHYLGESIQEETYSLKDILYNIPYVHRAYQLTYNWEPELFFPISTPQFVRKTESHEAWCQFMVTEEQLKNKFFLKILPDRLEKDEGDGDNFVVRFKDRFDWKWGGNKKENESRLCNYHLKVRKCLFYIHGVKSLWYVKRASNVKGFINRGALPLTYAAMHRLSELARYEPLKLEKHFSSQHNWLLAEFIKAAPMQFIDQISSEITGYDFLPPGMRS
jgi:YaaC-like Protein